MPKYLKFDSAGLTYLCYAPRYGEKGRDINFRSQWETEKVMKCYVYSSWGEEALWNFKYDDAIKLSSRFYLPKKYSNTNYFVYFFTFKFFMVLLLYAFPVSRKVLILVRKTFLLWQKQTAERKSACEMWMRKAGFGRFKGNLNLKRGSVESDSGPCILAASKRSSLWLLQYFRGPFCQRRLKVLQ